MFCVETVKDTVKVQSSDLGSNTSKVLRSLLDAKYPNRVIPDVGLVICIHDDLPIQVSHGVCRDACTYYTVTFSVVVFRPFINEILIGKIVESHEQGIVVSLGFFENIYVPAYWMLNPSTFQNNTWIWNVEDEKYEMEVGSEIRVRVKSLVFTKITKSAKGTLQNTTTFARQRSSSIGKLEESDSSKSPAMHITASICEDGLGLTSWWKTDEEEESAQEKES